MKLTRKHGTKKHGTKKHGNTKKHGTKKHGNTKKHGKTMKKQATMKFEDVDYATDIDVLTIMSKDKQISALNKVKQYLKVCKTNKSHIKEMTKRKEQIEALIKGE
jgi:hypothetical protein